MKWIVGIDEVGRGALAGPVVVAAAMMPRGLKINVKKLGALKDSKKLSKKRREAWARYFKDHRNVAFTFARVYPRGIESMNISAAANLAALRAFRRLSGAYRLRPSVFVFLDGGLFLGNGGRSGGRLGSHSKGYPKNAKTIIKGDEKITAIKIASIVAKVHRDRFMCRLAKQYPVYDFEVHKGYGTESHRRAIKKYGSCEAHRLTFISKSAIIKK